MKIIQIAISVFAVSMLALISPQQVSAAPNCPPQYVNICKQLTKILDDNNQGNNGRYQYTWDGTHLTVNGNFALYTLLNHDLSDIQSGHVSITPFQQIFGDDAFPSLLQQTIQASKGGQRVYLHLHQFAPSIYNTVGLSNQAPPQIVPSIPSQTTTGYSPYYVPNPVQQQTPTPVPVPSPVPNKAPPQIVSSIPSQTTSGNSPYYVPSPVQQQTPTPAPAPNSPKSVSVLTGVKAHNGDKVNKYNVNKHFITNKAGSYIEHDERAYLVDSSDKLWSCKISGLGARKMPDSNGEVGITGHVETLQFRSLHIAHVPGNHPMHSGCIISVQK